MKDWRQWFYQAKSEEDGQSYYLWSSIGLVEKIWSERSNETQLCEFRVLQFGTNLAREWSAGEKWQIRNRKSDSANNFLDFGQKLNDWILIIYKHDKSWPISWLEIILDNCSEKGNLVNWTKVVFKISAGKLDRWWSTLRLKLTV